MQLENFAEQGGLSGKMSQGQPVATKEEILLSWLGRWQVAPSMSQQKAGERRAWRWVTTGLSNGACLTRNGSEWRNDADVCLLSSILETGNVGPQYYLSQKDCTALLHRAEARGKSLPAAFKEALVSGSTR